MKNTIVILLVAIFSSGLMSCNQNKAKKLDYFVPELNDKGQTKISPKGDTIWHKIPKFSFLDEDGKELTENFFDDSIVIVDFFFATCPSICIPMSQNLSKIQDAYKNTPNIKILSHTVNPKHDTPQVLKEYANSYNADSTKWKFVTGNKKALYKQAREGYYITTMDGDGGELDFIHSEKFVLVDKNRNIRGFFRGTVEEDIKDLVKSIEILQQEYKK